MSTVEEIKAAAAALPADDQFDLFLWWVETETFKERQLAALKGQIEAGIADLEGGALQAYTRSDAVKLADDVCQAGRERLARARQNRTE
jgi:hypothetical protein